MPALADPRYELLAQGLSRGLSQGDAYVQAGFNAEPGDSAQAAASRLLGRVKEIPERVAELQQISADAVGFDRVRATSMALEDRDFARQQANPSAAVAATRLASDLNGLIVTKSLNITGGLEDMPADRLDAILAVLGGPQPVPAVITAEPAESRILGDPSAST